MKKNLKEFMGFYKAPFGWLKITSSEKGITNIDFLEMKSTEKENPNSHIEELKLEFSNYFDGKLTKKFSAKLDIQGTEFQKKVWKELLKIQFGKTISYGEISERLGYGKKAARAVGLANNKNKIPIVIPCHRVIGANGKLVGYAGGLNIKEYLLKIEK